MTYDSYDFCENHARFANTVELTQKVQIWILMVPIQISDLPFYNLHRLSKLSTPDFNIVLQICALFPSSSSATSLGFRIKKYFGTKIKICQPLIPIQFFEIRIHDFLEKSAK